MTIRSDFTYPFFVWHHPIPVIPTKPVTRKWVTGGWRDLLSPRSTNAAGKQQISRPRHNATRIVTLRSR
jgi:hypothetical protein